MQKYKEKTDTETKERAVILKMCFIYTWVFYKFLFSILPVLSNAHAQYTCGLSPEKMASLNWDML